MAEKNKDVYAQAKLPRHPAVWWSRTKIKWPFLVWLIAVVLAIFFYFHGARFGSMTGVVDTMSEDIAPAEDARLLAVLVAPGQTVRPGDVVAVMDTNLISAEIALQQALYDEASQAIDFYQIDMLDADLEMLETARAAESELQEQRLAQAQVDAEFESLRQFAEIVAKRRDTGFASDAIVAPVLARYAALSNASATYPAVIAAYSNKVEGVQERRRAYEQLLAGQAVDPQAAVRKKTELHLAMLKKEIELLQTRLKGYTLRARHGGTVSQILKDEGDFTLGGEPVVRLVDPKARRIRGFLPETNAHDLDKEKTTALVMRRNGKGDTHAAVVETIEPEVLGLPARVSPIPGQPIRGRRIVFRLLKPTQELLPGETVRIRLHVPFRSFGAQRAAPPPADSPEAKPGKGA